MVGCAVCLKTCIKKVISKMLAMSRAGVCKIYEQVSTGLQLWLCLLQLGVSVLSGEDHRTHHQREQRCAVKRST